MTSFTAVDPLAGGPASTEVDTRAGQSLLGPLRTTFTPPPSCGTLFINAELGMIQQPSAYRGQSCSQGVFNLVPFVQAVDDISCWPPITQSVPVPPFLGLGFYSPGLSCPIGYTSACTEVRSSDGVTMSLDTGISFQFQFAPKAGETAVGCCPMYEL
ncbi:hypothetical protein EV356DRAFT_501864 [Viridothelium virens]|uniref:Uncharacterized protein n=1 Tax=Viridothelium virens TaxID=1048519 RepID=A0A6A6H873_VIRVR|nr:hypothetical protein EV356DRAFT_501864 [Viridothelium virens]